MAAKSMISKMRGPLLLGVLLLAGWMLAAGCKSSTETESPPKAPAGEEKGDEESDMSELREVYGLPLPPEYSSIRRGDHRTRVTTNMSLDELEAFFESRLVDYEVLRPGNRLRVVPLRPYSSRADAYHFSGRRSHVVVEYRLPPDRAKIARHVPPVVQEESEVASESSTPTPRPRIGDRPHWLDDLRGQPVELRTEDGELLAPGAIWGEAYFPPEGSPLNIKRNRHNFGRPFGDWRSH